MAMPLLPLLASLLFVQDTVRFTPTIQQPTFAVREPVLRIRPGTVLVSRTGCLKHCSRGVTAAVYPENIWYQGVAEGDLREICESHLKAGTPVARLLMPEDAPWE